MKALGIFLLIFGLGSVLPQGASAEYRAFELKISKKLPDGKLDPQAYRLVLSTLDPFQYAGYYIVRDNEVVQYTRTWMCPGRTDERPLCPDPKLTAENPKGSGGQPSKQEVPYPPMPVGEVPTSPKS